MIHKLRHSSQCFRKLFSKATENAALLAACQNICMRQHVTVAIVKALIMALLSASLQPRLRACIHLQRASQRGPSVASGASQRGRPARFSARLPTGWPDERFSARSAYALLSAVRLRAPQRDTQLASPTR